MGINYRCKDRRGCGKRVTLSKLLRYYKREPVCPECGGELGSVSRKEKARNARRGCFCRGNDWPHRKGVVEDENHTCIHATIEAMEEAEHKAEFGIMETTKNAKECPF